MNLYLLQQYQFIQQLYKNNNYLDILLNIDDFFDILHIYAFSNWLDAEVVDVKFMKYFTNIILKSPRDDNKKKDKCPDPKAGIILTKYDCKVEYEKTTEIVPKEVSSSKDMVYDKKTGRERPKMETKKIWLIDIMIPNKHIINDNVYDLDAIQQKIEDKDDESDSMENIVSNNDELGA